MRKYTHDIFYWNGKSYWKISEYGLIVSIQCNVYETTAFEKEQFIA